MNNIYQLFFTLCLICCAMQLEAAWGSVAQKHSFPTRSSGQNPEEAFYAAGMRLLEAKAWGHATKEFESIIANYPDTSYAYDSYFFLGVCLFQMDELDLANEAFSNYLQSQSNPPYFYEAMRYKFSIAEEFKRGCKRRCLGSKQLPKWFSGYSLAVELYDEVIATLPNDEIAVHALYGKALVLWKEHDYRGAVEVYQTLIARFPKHEFCPESYILINRVYLDQVQNEFQNPDLLALAEMNLHRFEAQFPQEERLEIAREDLLTIKEVFAHGLYETARFYERTHHPRAAALYYQKAILDFPETTIAVSCRDRLASFHPQALQDLEKCLQVNPHESPDADQIDFSL